MRAIAAFFALCVTACSATDTTPDSDPRASVTAPRDVDEGRLCRAPAEEAIAEAKAYLLGLSNCEAVCTGLLTAGCWGVAAACAVLEVITIGGVTIPCSVALPVACVGATGGIAACAGLCG